MGIIFYVSSTSIRFHVSCTTWPHFGIAPIFLLSLLALPFVSHFVFKLLEGTQVELDDC